jgi:hypothetical protein
LLANELTKLGQNRLVILQHTQGYPEEISFSGMPHYQLPLSVAYEIIPRIMKAGRHRRNQLARDYPWLLGGIELCRCCGYQFYSLFDLIYTEVIQESTIITSKITVVMETKIDSYLHS